MSKYPVVGAVVHGTAQPQHLVAALLDPPGAGPLHPGVTDELVRRFDRTASDYDAPLTLPPDRIQSLADAVIQLAGDAKLCMELGARGRRYVIDTYDWRQIASQVVQAYRI